MAWATVAFLMVFGSVGGIASTGEDEGYMSQADPVDSRGNWQVLSWKETRL